MFSGKEEIIPPTTLAMMTEVWNFIAGPTRKLISEILVFIAQTPPSIAILLFFLSLLLYFTNNRINKMISWPYHFLLRILRLMGLIEDRRTWGVVYDSYSKEPIDPAYISIQNRMGKVTASAITDLDGRFGIILPRGSYRLVAEKTNYSFPSRRLYGKRTDGVFTGLYHGEWFEVVDQERSLAFAVPMDAEAKDWNQLEKKKLKINKRDRKEFRSSAILYFSIVGVIVFSRYLVYEGEEALNYLFVYIALLLIGAAYAVLKSDANYQSIIVDSKTNKPLAFARVKVFNSENKIQMSTTQTSLNGQFISLVPNGTYYISVERRDKNGQYSLVYTSDPFRVIDRSINKRFFV